MHLISVILKKSVFRYRTTGYVASNFSGHVVDYSVFKHYFVLSGFFFFFLPFECLSVMVS